MSCIFSWNAIFPQLLLAHFAIANQTGVFSTRGTLGADGLLKLYNLHWIPLKKYTSLHYKWKVYCKSLHHGSTSVYEEYIECIYFSLLSEYPNFRRKELGSFRKIKGSTCNNCSNLLEQLQQDFETKFSRKNEWWMLWKSKYQNRNPI